MSQALLFGACFLLGVVFRLVYKLITLVEKKTALVPVTVILDVAMAAAAVGAFALVSFFLCDGQIFSYLVAGCVVGFGLTSLLV